MSVTEPNPPGLQNWQADVAHRLVGSTPAPLRSRITWKSAFRNPVVVHSVAISGTTPCEARPRRRHWSAAGRRECLPAPRLEGLHGGALLPAAEAMGFSRAEPHTPVDRGNGQPSSAASPW